MSSVKKTSISNLASINLKSENLSNPILTNKQHCIIERSDTKEQKTVHLNSIHKPE